MRFLNWRLNLVTILLFSLVVILMLHAVPAFAQGRLSTEIARYFYQPIKLKRVHGSFNGFYKVLPSDNIPYEEVAFFENKDYPMSYYSNSLCLGDKECGSIISLFDQKFHLGTVNGTQGAYVDIHLDSSWWLLNTSGRLYICSLAAQRGASAYSFNFLLFDITDKRRVRFYCFDTFAFDDVPLVGSLPKTRGQLCVLRTVINECFVTTPYAITDQGLVELKKVKGVPYTLKFEWSKWTPDEIKIVKMP